MQTLIRLTQKTKGRNPEKWFRRSGRADAHPSNQFLVVHIAYAALVLFLAGAIALVEVARYVPDKPLYDQGMILLPYFAALGWGVGRNGAIVNTFPYVAIGAIDLVSAAVLAAGAYFHRTRIPPSLEEAEDPAIRYHATWDNPKKLGRILGTHLIFWGIGAALLVAKAMFLGGLYDANLHEVRVVTDPTLDFGTIASYRTRLFYVDNLEDLVGGHIYIAAILIAGGLWHILVEPWQWVKDRFVFNGDGILSYSLFGVALGGFAASYFCGFNAVAHPIEFYGPTLELKSALLPHYLNPIDSSAVTSRVLLANGFFYAAFLCFGGAIWELARATGYRFANIRQTWKQAATEVSPFPVLSYQKSFHYEPQSDWGNWYEAARVEPKPAFHHQSPDADHFYDLPKTARIQALTHRQEKQNTLYEVNYHSRRSVFYHSPPPVKIPGKTSVKTSMKPSAKNGGDRPPLTVKYEPPRANASPQNGHFQRVPSTFYGNHSRHTQDGREVETLKQSESV